MIKKIIYALIVLLIIAGAVVGVSFLWPKANVPPITDNNPNQQLANPASQNCIDKGGTLQIVKKGDGSEYGICYFEDNRQCEEWTLFRGDCPVGGLKITGYITAAAQYCVITGGVYTITDVTADPEKGTCSFKDGSSCDVFDYYNGGICGK